MSTGINWSAFSSGCLAFVNTALEDQTFDVAWEGTVDSGNKYRGDSFINLSITSMEPIGRPETRWVATGSNQYETIVQPYYVTIQFSVITPNQTFGSGSSFELATKLINGFHRQDIRQFIDGDSLGSITGLGTGNVGAIFPFSFVDDYGRNRSAANFEASFNLVNTLTPATPFSGSVIEVILTASMFNPGAVTSSSFGLDVATSSSLFLYSNGLFSRASEASYIMPDGLGWAENNVLRIENRNDGLGDLYLLEGTGSNIVGYSENFAFFLPTLTGGYIAPDSESDAYRIDDSHSGSYDVYFSGYTTTKAIPHLWSAWIRQDNDSNRKAGLRISENGATISGSTIRIDLNTQTGDYGITEGTPTFVSITSPISSSVTQKWWNVQIGFNLSGSGQLRSWFYPAIKTGSVNSTTTQTAATGSIYAWGHQVCSSSFVQSYVRASGSLVLRDKDNLYFTDTPSTFRSGSWYLTLSPYFSSGQIDENQMVWFIDDNNYLQFSTGSSSTIIEAAINGTTYSLTGSWSQHQNITVQYLLNSGSFSVTGLTTGNQTFNLSGSKILPRNYLYIGQDSNNQRNYYGRLSEPRQVY